MNTVPLSDATTQHIQLELLRRAGFNAFDGHRVAASLERHEDLWLAACMDRLGVTWRHDPERLPSGSLIKLRDLRGNHWNADTLFVLTDNRYQARTVARLAVEERWHPDDITVHTDEEAADALGMGHHTHGLVSLWWD
ncbi:hypothetical protein BJY24_003365 [Nocardia transvalensis]|uniref:Uncharacterized protein n=1 Tax=Nocardia transvalensis TaxID=37333 RepID=A0A7W9PF54_9NOCA|nr:hypothetical protein [Nocardia transvalensis]MBB5914498.1 hypothetical protein [Nocardia transvalensis]